MSSWTKHKHTHIQCQRLLSRDNPQARCTFRLARLKRIVYKCARTRAEPLRKWGGGRKTSMPMARMPPPFLSCPSVGAARPGPRALSDNPSPQIKKTPAQRRADRLARLERFEKMRIRGEARGWQIKSSAGMPVWQFINGGAFQPVGK